MARIVATFFISLDGVVERPDQWHFPYFTEQMGEVIGAGMQTRGAYLMGRRLYDEWAAHWTAHPDDDEFGPFITPLRKYVLSSHPLDTDWENSHLVTGDDAEVAAQVARIKEETEGDIGMSGCATTVRWLLAHGLLDELELLVHPLAVGTGQRLFEDTGQVPLELIGSTVLDSGVLHLRYAPAPVPSPAGS